MSRKREEDESVTVDSAIETVHCSPIYIEIITFIMELRELVRSDHHNRVWYIWDKVVPLIAPKYVIFIGNEFIHFLI